jgi:MoxR-like ATPase
VDRFLMKLHLDYPSFEDEGEILELYNRPLRDLEPVSRATDLRVLQARAETVHVDDDIRRYIIELVRYTRQHRRVYLGCSPRAGLSLMYAAKARAFLRGRDYVLPDDVKALALSVLAHRILLAPEAELEGMDPRRVVQEGLESVRSVPRVRSRSTE